MDIAIVAAAAAAGGGLSAFCVVIWRERTWLRRLKAAGRTPESVGVGVHEHVYDTMIADGRGWKCVCGAKYPGPKGGLHG